MEKKDSKFVSIIIDIKNDINGFSREEFSMKRNKKIDDFWAWNMKESDWTGVGKTYLERILKELKRLNKKLK